MEVGWSTPRPGHFAPGKDPIPNVEETGWDPGPVWTDAENLLTGIRSKDRPARSESLYRLSYPGAHNGGRATVKKEQNSCRHSSKPTFLESLKTATAP